MKMKILKVGKVRLQPIPECRIGLEKNLNNLGSREKFYNFLNLCQILDPSNSEFQNILNIPKSRPNSPNPVIIDNEEASNVKATGTKDVGPGYFV